MHNIKNRLGVEGLHTRIDIPEGSKQMVVLQYSNRWIDFDRIVESLKGILLL